MQEAHRRAPAESRNHGQSHHANRRPLFIRVSGCRASTRRNRPETTASITTRNRSRGSPGLPGDASARSSTCRQSPCRVRRNRWCRSTQQTSTPLSKRTTDNHDRTIPHATQRRPIRRDAATHLFTVGQAVRLKGGFGTLPDKFGDIYRITGTLPPRGNSPQYRIRNDDERHERVTTEDSLEPVDMAQPVDDTTLIERTFGHGQGTETQQPRDSKAEAGKGAAEA